MARVIADERTVVVKPWWARVRIIVSGALLGLIWWVLTALLRAYVIEPLACRDLSSAGACVDSLGVAGNVATVLVAVIGAFILVRTLQPRPIIISVAAAAILWSLGQYIGGLAWYEALLWAVVIYAVTYSLFGLIARIVWLPGAVIAAVVTVLIVRTLLVL
ncbi:MAG: rane protein of unknown function [Candidatus Saccharibacteria bacterium]|nr:rane protein of unknown function [Candidatus Saccharibacteria bacterium]